jgi:hypothetical protein
MKIAVTFIIKNRLTFKENFGRKDFNGLRSISQMIDGRIIQYRFRVSLQNGILL